MSRTVLQSTLMKTGTQRRALRRQVSCHNKRRFLSLEALEARSLMAVLVSDAFSGPKDTTISGTVYEDLNSNGLKDNGENGIAGWTVYLDLDNSGTLNNDAMGTKEPTAVTNVDGDYVLGNSLMGFLKPSTYRVGEVVQAGWSSTGLLSRDVVVAAGKESKLTDFFNFAGGEIVGTVFNDLDGDKVRSVNPATGDLEPGLAGWTVFLDLDGNKNPLPDPADRTTVTDSYGFYSFTDLPANEYEVFEVVPAGWEATKDNKENATVIALQQSSLDFGNANIAEVGSLSGTIWQDENVDGIRNVDPLTLEFTEPGLADWTVWVDLNYDGVADPSESTVTDANGKYQFLSLPAGNYLLTEELPDGWVVSPEFASQQIVTIEAGRDTIADDFANSNILNGSLRGIVWNDANRNGLRDKNLAGDFLEPGLASWTIFLDLDRNGTQDPLEPATVTGADGSYSFLDLQVGEYKVREVVPTGWEVAPTFSDNESVVVFSGTETLVPDFANFSLSTLLPGSVSGTVWNDLNDSGIRDVSEPGLAGWTVFADLNSNGVLDSGDTSAVSDTTGAYSLTGLLPGTVTIVEQSMSGWRATSPPSRTRTLPLRNGDTLTGQDFGNAQLKDSTIRGTVFADSDQNGTRGAGERGLADIVVYLDVNNNSSLDVGEPQTVTSADQFYTPSIDEAGTYSFTHLSAGTYTVRVIVPATLSATPAGELVHLVTITAAEDRSGVDTAAVFRKNEIHGVRFDDTNGNHQRDVGEAGVAGATVYIDRDRDNVMDADEPRTVTADDGSYSFRDLPPGAYVVREIVSAGHEHTYPTTTGGTLWPSGISNPAVGNVTPSSITKSLATGESYLQTVSITLPNTGALTNLVDVFLLFDDTGSFVNNSPIVRAAFPNIIATLQASLPGIDLGFGVGRFEEYGNFAFEYSTGRPFVLNQPIVAANTAGYMTAIQAALNRTTPGYGGDGPETDIEALYQLVTGAGFDGNNNGSVLDSGPAGLATTQLNPGASGDVPSFASFLADPGASVLPAAGTVGGAGFRAGALPIILTATDIGFAYQPKGETSVTGVGGISLPVSSLTGTSRPTTPYNSGAGLQQTVTALNALGALVIGLGTNPQANIDPRQGLEALSQLTGAVNRSTATIANGTADPIAPGDPLYFQISSGFATSVANGVVTAIQNAVTNVAVNVDIQASDPRVKIVNHSGIRNGIGAGQTATFDVEFVGDGVPHRFDLQFVRAGTNVILGSIPVVIGTPIPGDGYEFEDLEEGEIELHSDFGARLATVGVVNTAPSFVAGGNRTVLEDSGAQTVAGWATNISPGPEADAGQTVEFVVTNDVNSLFSVQPSISPTGTLTFTPAANAHGTASVTVMLHDNGGTFGGGADTSAPQVFTITVDAVNDAPVANGQAVTTSEDTAAAISLVVTDVDGDALAYIVVTSPSNGTLTGTASHLIYTPDANYHGSDSFTFHVNDGTVDSNLATVTITVDAVNDAPVANGQAVTTSEDTAAAISLVATDVDSDTLAYVIGSPSHGTLTGIAPNLIYTPDANFHGNDSFTYKVHDGAVDSNVASVTVTVDAINDAPVGVNDTYSTDEDMALSIAAAGVLMNDTDVDNAALRAVLATGPSHGTLTLDSNGSFTYVPAANYNGNDSFTYKATDGSADSNVVTVNLTVNPVNDAPVATNDAYSTNQDTNLVVSAVTGVLLNDTDVDSNSLTAQLSSGPSHGSLTLGTDGSFTYIPNAGYAGVDSFIYFASDGSLSGNNATVTIDVRPVTPPTGAKFIVVDRAADDTFEYSAAGQLVDNHNLNVLNESPRGIATNADGSLRWVIDASGAVFVYDQAGKLTGAWFARGLSDPEGIATNGRDVWIVDRDKDRVLFFANGAARRFGIASPSSSFTLQSSNREAMDIATDGMHLWVVDDASTDRVFRYTIGGKLEGSWKIDPKNSHPTGLTIDPQNVSNIWIVDVGTDRVYQYDAAVGRLSGGQLASETFVLATANRNPQGIADPPPVAPLTAGVAGKQVKASETELTPEVSEPAHTSSHEAESASKKSCSNPTTERSAQKSVVDLRKGSEQPATKAKSSAQAHDEALTGLLSEYQDLTLADSLDSLVKRVSHKR